MTKTTKKNNESNQSDCNCNNTYNSDNESDHKTENNPNYDNYDNYDKDKHEEAILYNNDIINQSIQNHSDINKQMHQLSTEFESFLKLIKISILCMVILMMIGLILSILYHTNSNYIECAQSLSNTVTFFGTSNSDVAAPNATEWAVLLLYCLYTLVSTMSVWYIHNRSHESRSNSLKINCESQLSDSVHSNKITNCNHDCWFFCKIILFIISIVLILVIMSAAVIAYDIFHTSLPNDNTLLTHKNDSKFYQILLSYGLPSIIAIEKYFLLPYCISKIINLFKFFEMNSNKQRYYVRHLTQCFRFFILILCPLLILIYFDNGCIKNWKNFWKYCQIEENNHNCITLSFYPTDVVICYDMCSKITFISDIVWNRCLRRIMQVVAPLYIFKMTLAVWFPLLLYIFKLMIQFIKSKRDCDKTKNNYNQIINDDNDNNHRRKSLDLKQKLDTLESFEPEYVSLLSSIEMIIVFGWAIPLITFLYIVTMFGYFAILIKVKDHSAGLLKYDYKLNKYFCVSYYLMLSLFCQQLFGIAWFYSTMSSVFGLIAVVNAIVNMMLYILLFARACKFCTR